MSKQCFLSRQTITEQQDEWIRKETERTGNGTASVIRSLIQEKIDKEKPDRDTSTTRQDA